VLIATLTDSPSRRQDIAVDFIAVCNRCFIFVKFYENAADNKEHLRLYILEGLDMDLNHRIRVIYSVVIVTTFAAGAASCGKSTRFSGPATMQATDQRSVSRIQSSSDAQVTAKSLDSDELLRDLLDKERQDRIAGDETLDKRIDDLSLELASLRKDMETEISRLDATDIALGVQIATNKELLADQVDGLEAKLSGKITDLKVLVYQDLATLETRLTKAREDAIAELKDGDIAAIKKDLAGLQANLLAAAADFAQFKLEVAQTYATKHEFNNLKTATIKLANFTDKLNKKVDYNDEATRELISEEVHAVRKNLIAKIDAVDIKAESIGKQLTAHISDYKATIADMATNLTASIATAKTELYAHVASNSARVEAALNYSMERKAVELGALVQGVKIALTTKIDDLKAEIDASTDADKNALYAALNVAKDEFESALWEEQAGRARMQSEMEAMAKQISDLNHQSAYLLEISVANKKSIAELRSDFSNEKSLVAKRFTVQKDDMNAKLTALEGRMNNKLLAVANDARYLVENLGQEVADQFADVATSIVSLKNKQAAVDVQLNKVVSEINAATDMEKFERDSSAARQDSANALAEIIKAIRDLEMQFASAISPDQNNPGYYDVSFRPIMVSCGGNPEATFANALGLDSFQFLAQEYVRQLVFGARQRNGMDRIFHGYDRMIATDNLLESTVLSALRHTQGSESASCISQISAWARAALLTEESPAHKVLRNVIAGDANLARAIEKFKLKIAALAIPIQRLDGILGSCIAGQQDVATVLRNLRIQTSLVLLDAAHNSLVLSEQNIKYDKILAAQKDFAASNAVLSQKIDARLPTLQASIADAIKPISGRVGELEAQVGNLTTAMKKALDVILSLASRSGQEDLRQAALAAGSAINYVPTRIRKPFTPKITEIQHFFRGTALANNSAACTGNEILPGIGGVHTQYQHGGWNACWVNFRSIPSAEWLGSIKTLWFRVFAAADRFLVSAPQYSAVVDFFDAAPGVASGGKKMSGNQEEGVFDFDASNALVAYVSTYPAWDGVNVKFTPQRKEGAVWTSGKEVIYNIQLYSPIVLDFVNKGHMQTVNPMEKQIRFDLNADGQAESTGWVAGDEGGLLALDRNGNGEIDDGSELFGEATALAGSKKSKDGYQALAQYDLNKDGTINASDAVFKKLVVWFDYNVNGVSDKGEIKSLTDVSVSALSTKFTITDANTSFDQNGNQFRLTSKFWGPSQCGSEGCKSHDVYFNTAMSLAGDK
jgi:hypothetical protein